MKQDSFEFLPDLPFDLQQEMLYSQCAYSYAQDVPEAVMSVYSPEDIEEKPERGKDKNGFVILSGEYSGTWVRDETSIQGFYIDEDKSVFSATIDPPGLTEFSETFSEFEGKSIGSKPQVYIYDNRKLKEGNLTVISFKEAVLARVSVVMI